MALDAPDLALPTPLALLRALPRQKSRLFPAQPTPLIGREGELDMACRTLLRPDVRLLTFRGPAGAGKTRLAMATADLVLDAFEDGVYLVDLAPLDRPDQVCSAIARTIGVRETREQSLLGSLVSTLADSTALLVLDNFEHVQAAAEDIGALLSLCPSLKILTTSRVALRLRWESIFPVGPLPLPAPQAVPDLEALLESPAVRLYVERAKAADANFELTTANAATIAELCIRLDGLPLAIELAAARSPLLPPAAFLARLRHRLDLLVDGAHDLPERQQSLRAAIRYSYDLLSAQEQSLFRLLAVFAGGCEPEAVAFVVSGPGTSAELVAHRIDQSSGPMLDRLADLAHKSLLQQEPQLDGEVRFRMLETVRAYAGEQLHATGELVQTRQRVTAYFTALAQLAQVGLRGAGQRAWLERLKRERDNISAILRSSVEDADGPIGLRLATALEAFWEIMGLHAEGRAWINELLALPTASLNTPLRALALDVAGRLAASQGDDAAAEVLANDSLAIQRELGDRAGCAASLSTLAVVAHRRGDAERARAMLEESLAIGRDLGDQWGVARVLRQLGDIASESGQYPTARSRYEESVVQSYTVGDAWGVAISLESMGSLALAREDPARALRLIAAASAIRDDTRASSGATIQRLGLQQTIAAAESALDPAAAAAAHLEGRAMSLEEAVLFARTLHDRVTPPPVTSHVADGPLAWLTRREQEVAMLLLRGLSNRQIAEALVITERTAETHVCRILSKLELGSRAQIAAWVMDHTVKERARVS
jgi:non-specific serine/threonine protein kinase